MSAPTHDVLVPPEGFVTGAPEVGGLRRSIRAMWTPLSANMRETVSPLEFNVEGELRIGA